MLLYVWAHPVLLLPVSFLQGSDQKRQAFSKRKRGIVLKAYQLYKLTDAKVGLRWRSGQGAS